MFTLCTIASSAYLQHAPLQTSRLAQSRVAGVNMDLEAAYADAMKPSVSPSGKQDFLEASPYYDQSNIPVNTYKNKSPYTAKVVSCKRIVGPEATGETCHIIFDHKGNMPYWEGQSYGVIPPGTNPKNGKPHTVRLYSIAPPRDVLGPGHGQGGPGEEGRLLELPVRRPGRRASENDGPDGQSDVDARGEGGHGLHHGRDGHGHRPLPRLHPPPLHGDDAGRRGLQGPRLALPRRRQQRRPPLRRGVAGGQVQVPGQLPRGLRALARAEEQEGRQDVHPGQGRVVRRRDLRAPRERRRHVLP